MAEFSIFKDAVKAKFESIIKDRESVFRTDTTKDEIWEAYMNAFPEGTNEMFRERREYDCVYCKQFIRAVGNIVAITPGGLISVWDLDLPAPFNEVAANMAAYVKGKPIRNVFKHGEGSAGVNSNKTMIDDEVVTFHHFHAKIPKHFIANGDMGSVLSEARSTYDVYKRGVNELTIHALETTIELIEQGSLYRGDEFKANIELFLHLKKAHDDIASINLKDQFCWLVSVRQSKAVSRIRNSAIGTLLQDLSEDMELESAVRKYEVVVAPDNYKRPTALVTKSMIAKAEKAVSELGLMESLPRRYAVAEDITINNVLFADRGVRKVMKNAFDELSEEVAESPKSIKNLDKVEEVDINTFVETILPKAESVEIMVENKHDPNFVTLLAPTNPDAKCMLKWPNNFSWSYTGEVADSIKQRVKAAGGNVTGELRASLAWCSRNDLDLHLIEPCKNLIYYSSMHSRNKKGRLDVDNTTGGTRKNPAVENITWQNRKDMQEGRYKIQVHNYAGSNRDEPGFDFEFEYMGTVYNMSYDKTVPTGQKVTCMEFDYTHKEGVKIVDSLPQTTSSKEVWGAHTQKFTKVNMVMFSPNHWDDNAVGNKHVFFVLDGCVKPGSSRGFYNEFLTNELTEHRKVFEMLGNKMKADASTDQLSGVGFSTTQRNHVFCRIQGSFSRTIKVTF